MMNAELRTRIIDIHKRISQLLLELGSLKGVEDVADEIYQASKHTGIATAYVTER